MPTDSNSRSRQRPAFDDRVRTMRRWRIAISAVAVVLGLVLVLSGNVLVGVAIGGLALARLVMFNRLFAGTGRGRSNVGAEDRQWFRDHARDEFLVASEVIGCGPGELREQFRQGRSIADVATARSVDVQRVTAAITDDLTARALDAERTGGMSHDDAQRVHALAPQFADRLVHRHGGDTPRA